MRFVWLLVIGTLSGCRAGGVKVVDRSSLPQAAPRSDWQAPVFKSFDMPNGLRVWHLERGQTPTVSLRLVFPHGASADPAGKDGLTSFMADLMDEGAGQMSALELSEAWQRLATDFDAYADTDSLVFSANALVDKLDASMQLLAEVIMRPRFSSAEFERLKKQRVGEALAEEADPDSGREAVLRAALFGAGYGGHLDRGTRKSLEQLLLQDVKKHHDDMIHPDGAALIVVGPVAPEVIRASLERYFRAWGGKVRASPRPLSTLKPKRAVYFVHYPDAEQTGVSVARVTKGMRSPDYFSAKVFARVLGSVFTSRLNMNLREAKSYTYGAYGYYRRWAEVGYFALSSRVKTDVTRPALEEMLKELKDIRGPRPITKREFREAIDGLDLGFTNYFERLSGIADQAVVFPLYNRPADWLRQWPAKLRAVTQAQAENIAKAHTDPKDYVIVLSGDRAKVVPELDGFGLPVLFYDARGNSLETSP